MSISVGSLGLMSLRSPFAELVTMVLGKTDLRSMFCLVVFSIVVLVLAYLTNPSENTFRAYLTEQSFRQHLSRLDDNVDDQHAPQDNNPTPSAPSRRSTLASAHALSFDNSSPFHFANRASISLRTPKHVFHSFGIFTVAAMVPLAKSTRTPDRDTLMISDSWYVGAFGRWWRGGIIEAWYQDVVARSKDEESWSSGILSMKNLDMLNDYNGLPFSTKNLPPHLLARGSPPRLRNRERPSSRPAILPTRSSTPPPLPKSASLPLHTARIPSSSSSIDRPPAHPAQPLLQAHSQSSHVGDQVRLGSSLPSRSSSTLFDQSPRIAEVLRQISLSKTTVLDLRTQFTECQTNASQSHSVLQEEVDSYRERKRREDASKLELKTRTKGLDDSKRTAESMKKDAEKKLKAAQNARDNATQRMDHLDKEIAKLQKRLTDDEALMRQSKETAFQSEQEITEALEHKKHEIKVAEEVVVALNQRARELEENIAEKRERLTFLKEHNQARKQDRTLMRSNQHTTSGSWAYNSSYDSTGSLPTPDVGDRRQSLTGFEALGRRPSISRDSQALPRPGTLALGNLSNFNTTSNAVYPTTTNATQAALRANGYSVFDDSVVTVSLQQHHSTNFSPFDNDLSQGRGAPGVTSPTSQSLIPSTLITSLDSTDGLSRSFQSESDAYMDKEWRGFNVAPYSHHRTSENHNSGFATVTASPTSLHGPSPNDFDLDPFEVRFMSAEYGQDHHLTSEHSMDFQRASWLHRTNSDPNHYLNEGFNPSNAMAVEKSGPRRWFSTKEKPKKGLNPDAKVFNLPRRSPPRTLAPGPAFNDEVLSNSKSTYDALNPNGLGSKAMPAPASTNTSLLRAFAPSPAEREALQRALGGSTNTSFERLPSLSDVRSIPSSPSHVHAHPVAHVPQHSAREMGKVLPSWLQSLPRIRKANFSPWDDEEPSSPAVNGGGSGVRHR